MSEKYLNAVLKYRETQVIANYSVKKENFVKNYSLQTLCSLNLESIIVEKFPCKKIQLKQVQNAVPSEIRVILDSEKNGKEISQVEGMIKNIFSEKMQNLYKIDKIS